MNHWWFVPASATTIGLVGQLKRSGRPTKGTVDEAEHSNIPAPEALPISKRAKPIDV